MFGMRNRPLARNIYSVVWLVVIQWISHSRNRYSYSSQKGEDFPSISSHKNPKQRMEKTSSSVCVCVKMAPSHNNSHFEAAPSVCVCKNATHTEGAACMFHGYASRIVSYKLK